MKAEDRWGGKEKILREFLRSKGGESKEEDKTRGERWKIRINEKEAETFEKESLRSKAQCKIAVGKIAQTPAETLT